MPEYYFPYTQIRAVQSLHPKSSLQGPEETRERVAILVLTDLTLGKMWEKTPKMWKSWFFIGFLWKPWSFPAGKPCSLMATWDFSWAFKQFSDIPISRCQDMLIPMAFHGISRASACLATAKRKSRRRDVASIMTFRSLMNLQTAHHLETKNVIQKTSQNKMTQLYVHLYICTLRDP